MLDADGARLAERRRPEPDVPDHVGLGGHGRASISARRPLGFVERAHRAPTPGPAGWRSRSLQSDFDPNLVRLFDKQAQGWVGAVRRRGGRAAVGVDQRPSRRVALQASLTQPVRLRRLHARPAARCVWRARWRSPRRRALPTTRSRSCACARTARTACRSPSIASTTRRHDRRPAAGPGGLCRGGAGARLSAHAAAARRWAARATATSSRPACSTSMPAT